MPRCQRRHPEVRTRVGILRPAEEEKVKLAIRLLIRRLAGEPGFESGLAGSEPAVLPLDDSPVTPQKTKRIGQKIQSFSPNPGSDKTCDPIKKIGKKILLLLSNPLYCLDPLFNESLAQPVLKYQPRQLRPADILLASPTRGRGYNIVTDDANETIPLAAPPTPRETISRSADETNVTMAPTLPESVVEVMP